ncbi:MAG: AAA family ATPase [Anaerosomatales bacterium]|nr:AAA family ATPase [Anaerosomatales bacterium]
MLTKMRIRNFKQFADVEVELAERVVFVGPNDAGKTTALQALALWDVGLKRWTEKRKGLPTPEKRSGVTINRRDLISIPVPEAKLLWRDLVVSKVSRSGGKQQTDKVYIEIVVEGIAAEGPWACGFEFYYANPESFYCRPMRSLTGEDAAVPLVPPAAEMVQVAFLPPMSGLAAEEDLLNPGSINVRLGEGRTAEVLRNLCYQLAEDKAQEHRWLYVCDQMRRLFAVELDKPQFVPERGQIVMSYRDRKGTTLDLSSSGRGMQQTLLLLAYLAARPGSVLLLDEPDAHLEVLRQREIYNVLSEAARREGSQIVAASHSEVVLTEAAEKDTVVAFVGKPHRIDDRGSQVKKALCEIGFDQYYQAELTGWVLYLEGSTDLAILQALARSLQHPAADALERPFVHFVANQPSAAFSHFHGLKEAKPDLVGFALFDRLDRDLEPKPGLELHQWERREIENYICDDATLLAWARDQAGSGTLFVQPYEDAMRQAIETVREALGTLKKDPDSPDLKVSEEYLDPLFDKFYELLGQPNQMRKTDFHTLAPFVDVSSLSPEVIDVLDQIAAVAAQARPTDKENT